MDNFNHFDQIANAIHTAVKQSVRKVAFDIQAQAQTLAPVDTGFLKNSIYTMTSTGARGFKGGTNAFPKLDTPENDTTAYVAVGALYGLYVEMGTVNMSAQPYFYQAVEWGNADLNDVLEMIAERLDSAGVNVPMLDNISETT